MNTLLDKPKTAPEESSAEAKKQEGTGRRQFLATSLGGFVLGFTFDGSTRATQAANLPVSATAINAYIRVGADESITIAFGGCEMGQGSMSGLAQIIAEDLMVDWSAVRVETALASSISYLTGGSSAVRGRYSTLRKAGATARDMLIAAGAQTWGVPTSECYAAHGTVFHKPTNRSLTYGALAVKAAGMPIPANPALVDPSAFRLIGQSLQRVDIPSKVDGSAVFGIDVRVPGMVYAAVRHAPAIGGTLASTPSKPSSAIAVVPLKASDSRGAVVKDSVNAVAVVADNTWRAIQLSRGLNAKWNAPANPASVDSAAVNTQAQQLLATGAPIVAESIGDVNGALAGAAKALDITYSFPYLAHACMEPLNCTASVTPTSCEVWAPTQAAAWVQGTAQAITGLPPAQITVHTTLLGGGLGRKIEQDYVSQAIQVSKAIGKPVKVTWPREEDFSHDQYRPAALVRAKAGIDSAGNVVAFHARNVSSSILGQRGWIPPGVPDSQATENLTGLRYNFLNRLIEWVPLPAGIPVGFWRSVGHSINAFVVETMIDELAVAAKVDPIVFRLQLLAADARAVAVIKAAAALAPWRNSLPAGHAWGVAFAESFNTLVCQIVDCSAATATSVRVNRVAIAVDCGYAVNPDSVQAQMQGGMLHGLSAALWGQITFANGVSAVRNFNRYRVNRMGDMPQVSVAIVNSGTPSGGAGEPATPPIGPAVANAYFRLTGKRMRNLPFFPTASTMSD